MTHIPHSDIRHFAIDINLTRRLEQAAGFLARGAIATGKTIAAIPASIMELVSLAYVAPFASRRDQPVLRGEDGRDPNW